MSTSASNLKTKRNMDAARVIRLSTPPRGHETVDGEHTVWMLFRLGSRPIRAVLVAFTDGVELEIYCEGFLRRRFRFLRDSTAQRFAERLRSRLERKGFEERRKNPRAMTWPREA